MASRDELIPEDFVTYLQACLPGFKNEHGADQWELAKMLWLGGLKRRQHWHFSGAMSFTHQELAAAFGRRFKAINERLGLFTLSSNYSMTEGYTRGYWLTAKVKTALERYMRRHWRAVTRLLYVSGQQVKAAKTLPAAIASIDTSGKAISTREWAAAKELNKVRVDIATLKRLRRWFLGLLDQYRAGRVPHDLLTVYPAADDLQRLHDMVAKIIRMAHTDVAGQACVPHRYAVSPSGRLYAKGISLQSAPILVKQAALHGMWEYDFSNCHFSIVAQMAAQFGLRCSAIEHYLANKPAVRKAIAHAAGITIEQTKECLLALMYGARESGREEDAIPEAIGLEAAQRLYKVSGFQALKADIAAARALILKKWPRLSANGSLVNACDKAISAKEPAARRLAHLVQGAEAKALMVAVSMYPDHVVLLQHDGFTAHSRLDARAIERAVFDALGYHLVLEEERLQLDPDAQFLRNRNKSGNGRQPAPVLGLRGSTVS